MPPVDADSEAAANHFHKLSQTGARLAIEVRGRANEFLREVDPFPFDEIKTGGSSILRFARTVRGPGLSAIADLLDIANKANAAITAVGVEDQASLAALRGLGFTAAQGNHLAKVGDLKDFKPAQVNDVRALLGLDALDTESLNALFRTESPAPQAEGVKKPQAAAKSKTLEKESAAAAPEDRKAKARAIALAKRAKTREARKAAAIERVKAKTGQSVMSDKSEMSAPPLTTPPEADPFEPRQAPRDLQQRLNEEFSGGVHTDNTDDIQETSPPQPNAPEASPRPARTPARKKPAPRQTSSAKPPSPADKTAPPTAKPAPPASLLADPQADAAKQKPAAIPSRKSAPRPKETAPQTERPLPAASTIENAQAAKPAISSGKPALTALKMPVSTAGARFVPVIRITGPNKDSKAAETVKPVLKPKKVEQPPMPAAAPAFEDDTLDIFFDPAPEETAPGANPEPDAPEPPLTPPVADDKAEIGDLHRDVESAPAAPHRPRKPKNFLTRKYQIMPTHFWPRSWKRRLRKMQARKEAASKAPPEPTSTSAD